MIASKHTRTFRSKKLHPEHVKLLNEAIRKNARGGDHNVHISYTKADGSKSERKVRPLAVKGKSLFVAHCHERNAIRSFKVERIDMIKQAFFKMPAMDERHERLFAHAQKGLDASLERDPEQMSRDYADTLYYFGEQGRRLRDSHGKKMQKQAFWDGFEKMAVSGGRWLRAAANRVRSAATPEVQKAFDNIAAHGDFLNTAKMTKSQLAEEFKQNGRGHLPGFLKNIKGKKNVIGIDHPAGQAILHGGL